MRTVSTFDIIIVVVIALAIIAWLVWRNQKDERRFDKD